MATEPVSIEKSVKIEKVVNVVVNDTDDNDPMMMVVMEGGKTSKRLKLSEFKGQDAKWEEKLNQYLTGLDIQDEKALLLYHQNLCKSELYHPRIQFNIHLWINKERCKELPLVTFPVDHKYISGHVITEIGQSLESARANAVCQDVPKLGVSNVCYICKYIQIYNICKYIQIYNI